MTQINSLNLPLSASTQLIQTLQSKIATSGGGQGAGVGCCSATGGTANEEWQARGSGLSLEERQLLLEERLQASREAEAAQALAERRLKLMEVRRETVGYFLFVGVHAAAAAAAFCWRLFVSWGALLVLAETSGRECPEFEMMSLAHGTAANKVDNLTRKCSL